MAFRIYEGLNVIFELKGPFAKLMTAERKMVVQQCLRDGGEWFRSERIPLRFTDWVYRLGYRVTGEWKRFKRSVLHTGRALPFIGTTPPGGGKIKSMISGMPDVENGEKMAVAWERSYVEVTGTAARGDILIHAGGRFHPYLTPLAEAFHKVAPEEYQSLAQKVAASFREWMESAKSKGGRSKKLTIEGATSSWVPRGTVGRHEHRGHGDSFKQRKSG